MYGAGAKTGAGAAAATTGAGAIGVAIAWLIECELNDEAYGKIAPNVDEKTVAKTTKT